MDGGIASSLHRSSLWSRANHTPKNISTDARQPSENYPEEAQTKPDPKPHSWEKLSRSIYGVYTSPGMWVYLKTLKQEQRINFGHDALPYFTMWSNLTPCQTTGDKVIAQMPAIKIQVYMRWIWLVDGYLLVPGGANSLTRGSVVAAVWVKCCHSWDLIPRLWCFPSVQELSTTGLVNYK